MLNRVLGAFVANAACLAVLAVPALASVVPVIEPDGAQPAGQTPPPQVAAPAAPESKAAQTVSTPAPSARSSTRIRRYTRRPVRTSTSVSSKAQAPKPQAVTTPAPASPEVTAPVANPIAVKPITEQKPVMPETEPEPAATSEPKPGALAPAGAAAGFILKLVFVLGLVWVSLAALKMVWHRGAGPLKLGGRQLCVEETTSLGPGVAVHLIKIGDERYLVGTAQGNINLLTPVSGQPREPQAEDQEAAGKQLFTAATRITETISDALQKKPIATAPDVPGDEVAHGLRQSTRFIDELRSRMNNCV